MKNRDLLEEIVNGRRMSSEEFAVLYHQGDLLEIGQAANHVREKRFGNNIASFIIDRNINYTNICSCKCRFCAFYRDKEENDAYVIDEKTLFEKIEEAVRLGASQLMIQGGLNDELDITFFEEMFRKIKSRYDITIHSLTAPEIVFIAKVSKLTVRETLLRLKNAGLDSLPGGGAEVLHDDIRQQISPNKIKTAEWLKVMKTAHGIGLKTTATMMMGSLDQLEHRLYHLDLIRKLQEETRGFRAFIMWTYQPGNNELMGEKMPSVQYLRFLALARLYLDNIEHIQGSWVTQGEKIGQLSLLFGADDLGSIMIEENVVRSAGLVYKMDIDKMVRLISAANRVPALRNTEYDLLKLY